MSQKIIREIVLSSKVVAVVGLSDNEAKPSYGVAEYLQACGFRIIPVNPFVEEVLGEKSYRSLLDVPFDIQKTVDIVDIFRRSEDVLPIVEQAVAMKTATGRSFVVWLQQGIVNEQAAEVARKAGLTVIMDKCLKVEHIRLRD